MTMYPRPPSSPFPSFPSDRYTRTNPLRREFGLKRLSDPLPEPLRTSLIRTWRHRVRFDGKEAIQSIHRPRPSEAELFCMSPRKLGWIALAELGASRRVVEAPLASISRETRNMLLSSQGVYLQQIYSALARQIGEAAALAIFQQAVDEVR